MTGGERDVWREAVHASAEAILATWVHQPRVSKVGPSFLAECTTPGCVPEGDPEPTRLVGHFEQADTEAQARAAIALHIARVHWPEDA